MSLEEQADARARAYRERLLAHSREQLGGYVEQQGERYKRELLAALASPEMVALARQEQAMVMRMVHRLTRIHQHVPIAELRSEMSLCRLCLRTMEDFEHVYMCSECRAAALASDDMPQELESGAGRDGPIALMDARDAAMMQDAKE